MYQALVWYRADEFDKLKGSDLPLERSDISLPELWQSHARFAPDKLAVVCGERRETWSQLDAGMNRVANRLIRAGVGHGDKVAVVMANCVDMLYILYGIVKAGACVVPISMLLRAEQIAVLVKDSEAIALIAGDGPGALGEEFIGRLPSLRPDLKIGFGFDRPGWTAFSDWIADAPTTCPNVEHSPDDDFSIIYSSGTTGSPKGILHSHSARCHWSYSNALELRLRRDSVALVTTSLYSNGSWFMLLPPLFMGATIVILESFSPLALLRTIAAERVTHTFMVPTQFITTLAEPELDRTDLTSLQSVLSAGSPLWDSTKAEIRARFTTQLFELYGFSEGFATLIGPQDVFERAGSVGKPVLGFDLRILDDQGVEVAQGESGEIVGRGAGLMKEYFRKAAETEEVIWRDASGRGFVRSGDIGRLDADGFLYILDRKKDMILSGGFNVFPKDIEAVVAQHPDVMDVTVIGIPHPKWGETPLAFVIARPGVTPVLDELREWCNQRLGKAQQLRQIELRADFPRNALGKVLKRVLREPYWTRTQ